MCKWKCDICKKEFDNFHAQGFDNKIYCPLCFFKEENRRLKARIEKAIEIAKPNHGSCMYCESVEEVLKGEENER